MSRHAAPHGVAAALLWVADKTPRTLRELDGLRKPARPTADNTLYQSAGRLVDRGYLRRRGRKYTLTAAGRRVRIQCSPYTHPQRVLRLLNTFAALTVRHFVTALHTTPGSVNGALGQLQRQGLIESHEVAARASHRVEYHRLPAGTAQAVAA